MYRILILSFISLVFLLNLHSCKKADGIADFETQDWLQGGSQTSFLTGSGAFGESFTGLSAEQELTHGVGDLLFESTFVSSPSPKNPGLGPVFNSVSCVSCHVNDGRGKAPNTGDQLLALLLRISIPGENEHGGPLAVPNFGDQFQQRGVFGTPSEGSVDVSYSYQTYTFPDGETYELRLPNYQFVSTYMPLPLNMLYSARMAPPVFGLGLLEAISESSIYLAQDEYDSDGDGVSGKVNKVWNVEKNKHTIGRFGWKAGAPSLLQQVAGAFHQDMGITNFLFPTESSWGQTQYDYLLDDLEITDSLLHAVTFYIKTLKAPARRDVKNPEVMRGKELFTAAKCISCHTPKQRTAVNVAFQPLNNQVFYPFTDLLLHDMGPGLADNRPDYLASGNEWKTTPLWGIGLSEVVNGHSYFLHDGRARSFLEAIMWHGGEAENSKNFFANLSSAERKAVLKYLKSL